jgi:hypothetical protein
MRALRDLLAHAVIGFVGIVCGALSVISLAIAAIIPAILGMLALALSPLRMISDRIRGN